MRAFFAINLPGEIKTDLAKIQLNLKNACPKGALYWVSPPSFHVTLQFISDLNEDALPTLIEAVKANVSKLACFELTLPSLELFPNTRRAKLISLTTEPHNLLKALADAIGQAMKTVNYSLNERPFRGHLTLGHFTYNTRKTPFTLPSIPTFIAPRFIVQEIVLFQSELRTNESRYHTLATFNLRMP